MQFLYVSDRQGENHSKFNESLKFPTVGKDG